VAKWRPGRVAVALESNPRKPISVNEANLEVVVAASGTETMVDLGGAAAGPPDSRAAAQAILHNSNLVALLEMHLGQVVDLIDKGRDELV